MDNKTFNMNILHLEGLKVNPQSSVPAFILLLFIYIFIMMSNIGLAVLIFMERSLHQPMYLLFCNMSINDAFGATVIIPRLLSDFFIPITERYIHYYECVIQAFCAHFYAGISHTVLMIMAFDRYVAICNPLQYATIMTNKALNSRALQTCATHLAVYVILFVSCSIIVILHRFPHLSDLRKLASILLQVVPPAMNPVIYGLQMKAIRQKMFIMFNRNT